MSYCTHFMLLTSAVVSEKGSLSSTDALVRGSTGGSGQGVKPGASNGEFPVCCEPQVVLAMGRRLGENGRGQLCDGCLVLNVTFEQCPGSRENCSCFDRMKIHQNSFQHSLPSAWLSF